MKKLISVLLLSTLLLCSCSNGEKPQESNSMIQVNYDKVSRKNNRTVLMEKYDYIKETTEYFEFDTEEKIPNWSIEYSTNEETGVSIQYLYGDEKQYFYNGTVYTSIDDDNRVVIPFKSSFDTLVKGTLKRENTLNYVYYKQQEGYETQNGYALSYWFTITNDVLNQFKYWDVHVGDTIKVDYNLNYNYEILDYTYYIVHNPYSDNPSFTKIVTSTTEFNTPFKFPDFVYEYDNAERVNLTITENYKTSSAISESFEVPQNAKIWDKHSLASSKIYTDYNYKNSWSMEDDVVKEDLILYTVPVKQK